MFASLTTSDFSQDIVQDPNNPLVMFASLTTSDFSQDIVQDPNNPLVMITSQNFNSADADVIFESTDHVRFHVHRKNLEAHAGAFPLAEIETNDEVFPLDEDSSTLEHLFHYVYPQKHPEINLLPSDDFFKLAEAAEQYEVFTLMDLCHLRMSQIYPQHPIEAFHYGYEHDYSDIMDWASLLLLDIPLGQIVTQLDPQLVIPWVQYHQAWASAAVKVVESRVQNNQSYCHKCRQSVFCHLCINLGQPLSRASLKDKLEKSSKCLHCSSPLCGDIISELEKALDTVPAFSTFMYIGQISPAA